MSAKITKPRVGVLALTLEFYEQLAPQLRPDREQWIRAKLLPVLSKAADVRFDRAAFRRDDVEQIVTAYEADGCEALLVVLPSYAPSLIAAPALQRTRLPIIVWNTQELWAVDAAYGDLELLMNHGVHGTQDLCNVLVRAGVPFEYVTGHVNDVPALSALADTFQAAHAVAMLRRARLGLLGHPFPGMGDFGLDTTHMAMSLGCSWEAMTVPEFTRLAAEADAAEIKHLIGNYRMAYEIAPAVSDADLEAAARAELALRTLVERNRLDALSYQFLAFGTDDRTETLPFVGASRLLADGIGFGGEGDLISAAFSAFMHRLQPPASFSEIFTIDFGGNSVLLSHMGEANVAMARRDRRARLVKRPAPIVPIRGNQLALVFGFEPGPATLAALTLVGGHRWRIIASPMTIEDFGPLPQMAVPHSKARPAGDVRDFLTGYAKAGGPHHSAICFGDVRRRLALAARFLGADYVEV